MTKRVEVCPAGDILPGESKIIDVEGLSVGIFNIDGEYFGLNNVCPHQLAPLCTGEVTGTVTSSRPGEYRWERSGRIIRCPWHHWEFDITTGESVFNPHTRTRTFDVEIAHRKYGTALKADEPPVDTYEVAIEEEIIVLYI